MKLVLQLLLSFVFPCTLIAQGSLHVDFKKLSAELFIDSDKKEVSGSVRYVFEVSESDTLILNKRNIIIEQFSLNGIEWSSLGENLFETDVIRIPVMPSKDNSIVLQYRVRPEKAMYFVQDQVWTQGQGKYTSHWLPSIDDVNDKMEIDLAITYKNGYQVIANGKLVNKEFSDEHTTWYYDMIAPMSSYLAAIAIGDYSRKIEYANSGVPLEYYYSPQDSSKVEPTYRHTKSMFDYLEEEIGFPYPWQNYKQVPVKDFLYSGMENTSLTIFSDSFVVDAIGFNDRNYVTVNAHEMAHQWFGDLVTATSGEHHWLQEGFATYYALLAERFILGDDHYYWQLFENAQELIAQDAEGKSTSLLDPKSSSTTFYKKGAWALHVLREKVGDSAFKSAVRRYLDKHQFSSVETSDFIIEVEMACGQDLTGFVDEWLIASDFPEDTVVKSLKRSEFMKSYLEFDCEDELGCQELLKMDVSDKLKVKIISQLKDQLNESAFQNSTEVRQAIALHMSDIPDHLKSFYESLLDDPSYVTKEAALYNLWLNFPEERSKYLSKTKSLIGFNDYNLRLLWLVLHLNTPEYQSKEKIKVLDELISYSLPDQHFELRTNAFNYLKLINAFEITSMKSLIQATTHHNWRFSKFAKEMLDELEQDVNYKLLIGKLKNQL